MFTVIENTPGYLPDADDPLVTEDYQEAVDYANELADQLEDDGYECDRSWASSGNYYAIFCVQPDSKHDLGRYIAIEQLEDDELTEGTE